MLLNQISTALMALVSSSILFAVLFSTQSGLQDQKSVIFLHSVIIPNQLLQHSKNLADIFLTLRNHVKIFLSQNILHNVFNVVYCKTLSVRTDRTDKTVIRVFRSSLIRVFTVCHSICFIYTSYCKENPNCSILGYFQYIF